MFLLSTSRALVAPFVALTLLGCGHRPKSGESIEDVCIASNDKKEATVSGYIKMVSGLSFCDQKGCPFLLTPRSQKARDGDQLLEVFIHTGAAPGHVEVKRWDSPSKKDIVFHDDGDKEALTGDILRITGTMEVTKTKGDKVSCKMRKVTSLKKLDK
jgi:hypothetical protein